MMLPEEPIYTDAIAEVRWSCESNQAVAGEDEADAQDQIEDEKDMELTDLQNLITNLNKNMFYNSVNSSITLSDLGDSFLLDYDDDDEPTEEGNSHDVVPTCPCRRTTCCSADQQLGDCQPKAPGRRASDLSLNSISKNSVLANHPNQSIAKVVDCLGRVADFMPMAPRRRQSDCTCKSIPEQQEIVGGKLLHTTITMKNPISVSSRATSRRQSDSTCRSIPEGQVVHICRWGEEEQLQVQQRDPVSSCLRQPTRQRSAHLSATAA